MVHYLDLPNELKYLVILSQKDLSSLSQTSKAMHRALLPQLYKRISLSWEAFKPPPRISSLLEIVVQSPDVADKVEELYFHAKDYLTRIERIAHQSYITDAKPKANEEDARAESLLQDAMRSMGLSQTESESILNGQDMLDAIIAIMIVHCPNLKVLHLDTGFLNQNKALPKIVQHLLGREARSSPLLLTKLERVYFGQEMLSRNSTNQKLLDLPLSTCLPFFYLSSLRHFSVPLPDSVEAYSPRPTPTVWPTEIPPVSTVRTLDVRMSRAKAATLHFVLKQTPQLKTLYYNYWPWSDADERLDCTELRLALESVSHTLTDLTISLKPFTTQSEEIEDLGVWTEDGKGIGSLAFLSRLVRLEIALPVLFNWRGNDGVRLKDALPSSLEDICIRDDCVNWDGNAFNEERTIEEVRSWIRSKAWKKCTPHLKRFGLRLSTSIGDDWSKESRNAIMDICESEGLEFWFVKSDPDQEYNAATDMWENADNPLRYPLQDPLSQ